MTLIYFSKEENCQKKITSWFGMAISYMYLKKENYKKAKMEVGHTQ